MVLVKCPYCEVELEEDDTYDMEYDESGMALRKIGHCPQCDRDYQWEQSALFHSWTIDDLRLC